MKKTYEGLSDEEIIEKIRQGENDAVDFLMEKYKNLVVRVWGWSGYFTELDKVYQDQILARTEHSF